MSVQLNYYQQKNNNYSSENKMSFQGLNKYLSKNFPQTAKEAVSSAKKYHKSKGYVGNLPGDWIENISKKKRKSSAKKVQNLFAKLAKKLYCPADVAPEDKILMASLKINPEDQNIDLQEHLTLLNQLYKDHYNNIITNNLKFINKTLARFKKIVGLDAQIETISAGYGNYGKVYKLSTTNKKNISHDFAFKVYHSDELIKDEINLSGKSVEAAREVYAKKVARKLFAKFYFGKIAKSKDKDGFILTEFLTNNNKPPITEKEQRLEREKSIVSALRLLKSRVVSIDLLRLTNNNNDLNLIGNLNNGKIYDIGHTINISDELAGKMSEAVRNLRKLYFNKDRNNNSAQIESVLQSMKANIGNYASSKLNNNNNVSDYKTHKLYLITYKKIIDNLGNLMKTQTKTPIQAQTTIVSHNGSHDSFLSVKPVFSLLENN